MVEERKHGKDMLMTMIFTFAVQSKTGFLQKEGAEGRDR